MKKSVLFVFLAFVMLFSLVGGPADSARAESAGSITLQNAQVIRHKGVVFTFLVVGEFASYHGSVRIGYNDYPLTFCREQTDGKDLLVKCMADESLAPFLGQVAYARLNGFSSSAVIRGVGDICYPVAIRSYQSPTGAEKLVYTHWVRIGTYCQPEAGLYLDTINFALPNGGPIVTFIFIPENQPGVPDRFYQDWIGAGYYYLGDS